MKSVYFFKGPKAFYLERKQRESAHSKTNLQSTVFEETLSIDFWKAGKGIFLRSARHSAPAPTSFPGPL